MSNPDKLIVPIVNLNGSDKDNLTLLQHDAHVALGAALEAMGKAYPHGRDFQISPEGDFVKAREQHAARMNEVARIQAEFMTLFQAIDDQ